jgi:hypothetical protein
LSAFSCSRHPALGRSLEEDLSITPKGITAGNPITSLLLLPRGDGDLPKLTGILPHMIAAADKVRKANGDHFGDEPITTQGMGQGDP